MKLDKKFVGEIVKVKDSSIVPDDQWVLFLAKDNAFAATLPTYLENCKKLGCDTVQIARVAQMIRNVDQWRYDHPELCKTPDAEGERLLD